MKYQYRPSGVCSQLIEIELENGKIKKAHFTGGCHGNTQGAARLVEGMDAKEAIGRLAGIRCGFKPSSCPDQLARALAGALEAEKTAG